MIDGLNMENIKGFRLGQVMQLKMANEQIEK
jgi:hypothetical protein